MTEEDREVETVDLTPDDDATLDELDEELEDELDELEAEMADEPTPDPPQMDRDAAQSLEEEAQELAVNYRDEAEGIDTLDRLGNALDAAGGDAEKLAEMHSRYEQQVSETEQRIDRLGVTRERVSNQPDDVPVLQTMAGGISFEVPANRPADHDDECYTRSDLVDEIDETVEALEDHVDDLEEQASGVEAAYEKTATALRILKRAHDKQEQTDKMASGLTDDLR